MFSIHGRPLPAASAGGEGIIGLSCRRYRGGHIVSVKTEDTVPHMICKGAKLVGKAKLEKQTLGGRPGCITSSGPHSRYTSEGVNWTESVTDAQYRT